MAMSTSTQPPPTQRKRTERPPQTRLTAHSTSIICQDIDIRGDITVGAGSIIHPKAIIYALAGGIVIGEGCIIEEMVVIVNRRKEVMRIGNGNHFMVGCRVESPSIGDYNTFQPRSKASADVAISHYCALGANTILLPSPFPMEGNYNAQEELPPYTVIYGEESKRRIWDGNGQEQEKILREKHSEFLSEIIPKFNRTRVV